MERIVRSCRIIVIIAITFLVLSFLPIFPSGNDSTASYEVLQKQLTQIVEDTKMSTRELVDVVSEEDLMNHTSSSIIKERVTQIINEQNGKDAFLFEEEDIQAVVDKISELYQIQLDSLSNNIIVFYKHMTQIIAVLLLVVSSLIIVVMKMKIGNKKY